MTKPFKIRTTRLTIAPEGATIYDERSISVTIDDEGGGEYLKIESACGEPGELHLDPEEWPHVIAALERLTAVIETNDILREVKHAELTKTK